MFDENQVAAAAAGLPNRDAWVLLLRAATDAGYRGKEAGSVTKQLWELMKMERRRLKSSPSDCTP